MQIIHERCCGLDVHKKSVVACILITHEDGTVQREIRTYATMTAAKHLASWAGVCPGNRQSGGKRLSGTATKGDVWLRAVLGEVAVSIARSRGTYLHAQYHRIARRRGKHKAVWAVPHPSEKPWLLLDVLENLLGLCYNNRGGTGSSWIGNPNDWLR